MHIYALFLATLAAGALAVPAELLLLLQDRQIGSRGCSSNYPVGDVSFQLFKSR